MKVEIWFDFTCPFSYIGKQNFDKALENFKHKRDVKVTYKSFCVSPDVNETLEMDSHAFLANHRNILYDEAKRIHDKMSKMALKEDIILDFEHLIPTTSKKAHQILKLMFDHDARSAFIDYIYKAHFEEGKDISSLDVLLEIASHVSIDPDDVKAVYESDMYQHAIELDYEEAEELGLDSVPAVIVDRSYYLPGGQPVEAYQEMLEKLYEANLKRQKDTEYCVGDFCDR